MADVHNRTRYLAGCRCEPCRTAQRVYVRNRRIAKAGGVSAPSAPAAPAKKVAAKKAQPGKLSSIPDAESVTVAVRKELTTYNGTDQRPALAAMALSLARILDTPSAMPQHSAAVGKLEALLTSLAKYGVKKQSKLGDLRADLHGIEGGKTA